MATIKIVDQTGKAREVDVAMEQHIAVKPGEHINLDDLQVELGALFKSSGDLLVVMPDGSVIVLADFFSPTAEGQNTTSVALEGQAYYPPDFENTVFTSKT